MRFVSMLNDGDSKTFQFWSDNNIYGSDIKIEKEECLNHFAEARHIVTLQSEGMEGEKGDSCYKIKTAIYASLMHCSSTDKKPMHGKCPEGESSWCFYKRAIAKGEFPGSHSSMRTYLLPQVMEKIMPVYKRLASDTILERCVAGKTQNSN
ncbi:uncharacterized protein TNCV_139661 [Trichonephila clavipes]|uniref:Uncharacterized protein n=1 Tax=Trichonephila clavipes TaxID=2585209 RepID=A0A8X6RI74_TRICX|nr:uncharacterized protein TNCV_139661 [Trichonephila clavipes]